MKIQKIQKNDYHISAIVGCIMLFVGIGSLFNGKNSIIDMITVIGSIGLIGQSIYQYKEYNKNKNAN